MGGVVRVAIVSPWGIEGRGGIERIVKYLVNEFDHSYPKDISWEVVPTRLTLAPFFKHFSTIITITYFSLCCLMGRFDLVHVNVAPRGSTWRKMLFAAVAKRFGIPVVLHLHGSGYDEFYGTLSLRAQQRVRKFFRESERVVVLGAYWLDFAVSVLGVDSDKIVIIPNGAPEPQNIVAYRNNIPHLVTLGRVGKRKGTDVLLDALATLPSDIRWSATIAGDGEVETFAAYAAKRGLQDRVRFTGWLAEGQALELLNTADIFVLPSRAENQPVAIIEAMARRLPVISTRIGAIPEQVENGVTGLLVEPGNPKALSEALEILISQPETRHSMGEAGRGTFETRFSIGKCAANFVREYQRALAS